MDNYWLLRFEEATEKAGAMVPGQSRQAYLQLAHHYWEMHRLLTPKSEAGIAKARERTVA